MREIIKEYWKMFVIPIVLIIGLLIILTVVNIKNAQANAQIQEKEKQYEQTQALIKQAEQEKKDKPYVKVEPVKDVPEEKETSQELQSDEKTNITVIETKPKSTLPAYIDKETKKEEPKEQPLEQEEPKTEVSKMEEPKTEVSKTEEPKTEVSKTEEPKQEAPKPIETKKAITTLTTDDIQHLKSYPTYSDLGGEKAPLYEDFQELYSKEANGLELLMTKFSPVHLYPDIKVKWITDPHLVYFSAIGQYCVRGVIDLEFYNYSSEFNLEPGRYQREVEYRLVNSLDADGKFSLKLESTVWLSDFYKAVE